MMKNLFTLLTLALLGAMRVSAETYTDEPVTVTWADPSTATVAVATPAAAVSSSLWSCANTDVISTSEWDDIKYTVTSSEQTFSFTFTPFPGLTFTPGSVEFDMVKFGSDNCFATIDIEYGDESTTQLADLTQTTDICRNKVNTNADQRHKTYLLDNTKASGNAITLKITLKPASNKKMGVANVVISGTVSGTTAAVTKYTVSVAANDESYGSVKASEGEVVDGNEVTLTATANRGYEFVNWTDNDNANAVVSSSAVYTFAPTANVNYTGNFAALPEYTVSVTANNDLGGTTSVTTFEDSKYYKNDVVVPEARPALGYVFTKWSDGSTDWQHAPITLSDNLNLVANFAALPEPHANAVWSLATDEDAVASGATAALTLESNLTFEDRVTIGDTPLLKVQPVGEKAYGEDGSSVLFTVNPSLAPGEVFVISSIELDAVRCETDGGNFTLKVVRDGAESVVASNLVPGREKISHYYFNLDDANEVYDNVVVKLAIGGGLATNKQYAFANVKVNGYTRAATPITATITSAGYATFSCNHEVIIPSSITAYYAVQKDASTVTLKEIEDRVIPAEEGVVLAGAAGTVDLKIIVHGKTKIEGNLLKANLTAGTPSEPQYYTLAVESGSPVFKASTGGVLAAGKAYLVLPELSEGRLSIELEGTTGISTVASGQEVDGQMFDLQGHRVAQPTKGLYIMNGKKLMVK